MKKQKFSKKYLMPLTLSVVVGIGGYLVYSDTKITNFDVGKNLTIEKTYNVDLIGNFSNAQVHDIGLVLKRIQKRFPKTKYGLELIIGNSKIDEKIKGMAVSNSNISPNGFVGVLELNSYKKQNEVLRSLKLPFEKDNKKYDYIVLYPENFGSSFKLNLTFKNYTQILMHEMGHIMSSKSKNSELLDIFFSKVNNLIYRKCKNDKNCLNDSFVSNYAQNGFSVNSSILKKSIKLAKEMPKVLKEAGLDEFYKKTIRKIISSEEIAETFRFYMSGEIPKNEVIKTKVDGLVKYLDSHWE